MTGSAQTSLMDTTARPHACADCGRRFVVIGKRLEASPRCVCGTSLTETPLASGVYEIRDSRRPSRLRAVKKRASPRAPAIPREPDLGYGESHGYGPAHGGPSGPGDAPATDLAPEATPAPSVDGSPTPHS
jgi:hypothetical protein